MLSGQPDLDNSSLRRASWVILGCIELTAKTNVHSIESLSLQSRRQNPPSHQKNSFVLFFEEKTSEFLRNIQWEQKFPEDTQISVNDRGKDGKLMCI